MSRNSVEHSMIEDNLRQLKRRQHLRMPSLRGRVPKSEHSPHDCNVCR